MSCNCGKSYVQALERIKARAARQRGKKNSEKELEKKLRKGEEIKNEKVK